MLPAHRVVASVPLEQLRDAATSRACAWCTATDVAARGDDRDATRRSQTMAQTVDLPGARPEGAACILHSGTYTQLAVTSTTYWTIQN